MQLQTVTETVYEQIPVADELLVECTVPDLDSVKTNADLERVAIEAVGSLDSCNEDKSKIREGQQQ